MTAMEKEVTDLSPNDSPNGDNT